MQRSDLSPCLSHLLADRERQKYLDLWAKGEELAHCALNGAETERANDSPLRMLMFRVCGPRTPTMWHTRSDGVLQRLWGQHHSNPKELTTSRGSSELWHWRRWSVGVENLKTAAGSSSCVDGDA